VSDVGSFLRQFWKGRELYAGDYHWKGDWRRKKKQKGRNMRWRIQMRSQGSNESEHPPLLVKN